MNKKIYISLFASVVALVIVGFSTQAFFKDHDPDAQEQNFTQLKKSSSSNYPQLKSQPDIGGSDSLSKTRLEDGERLLNLSEAFSEMRAKKDRGRELNSLTLDWLSKYEPVDLSWSQEPDPVNKFVVSFAGKSFVESEMPPTLKHAVTIRDTTFLFGFDESRKNISSSILRLDEIKGKAVSEISVWQSKETLAHGLVVDDSKEHLRIGIILPEWGDGLFEPNYFNGENLSKYESQQGWQVKTSQYADFVTAEGKSTLPIEYEVLPVDEKLVLPIGHIHPVLEEIQVVWVDVF